MSAQVKLVLWDTINQAISEQLSLYAFDEGLSMTRDGWEMAVAPHGADPHTPVADAMTLIAKGTSHDDLAAVLQSVDDMVRKMAYYAGDFPVERYQPWLYDQLEDESNARRAFLTAISSEVGSSLHGPTVSPGNLLRNYELAFERMPYWEEISTNYLYNSGDGVSCAGGTWNYITDNSWLPTYGGTIPGTEPARIERTSFIGWSGGPLYEFWMGFRTSRFGTPSQFETTWEIEDGTLANDTSSGSDGTASGGSKATCTFGDESILPRATITVGDVTGAIFSQGGRFNVLLRAKVGSSTTCYARLLDGFSGSSLWRTQDRVKITSTSWLLHSLGEVSIPSTVNTTYSSDFFSEFALRLEAERTSGSGNLDMDCLYLIPSAEGAIHASGGAVQTVGGSDALRVIGLPNGIVVGAGHSSSVPSQIADVTLQEYAAPVGDGILVLVGQRSSSHSLTDEVLLSLRIYPRWRTLRGAD
jgi:hypothetical protein